ncbi:class I SAM-dependent methyltransferase [Ensifer sp.]|jgi:SAM-dependent methyltransferase|uniref:class I SAM-dependent methyltransferase n=1 Tax=Ensifer sp. TaxID=1872086 RepID=UPI002E10C79E|nr:class I SAM-dependent methyltransferase [Ensifer sp.]
MTETTSPELSGKEQRAKRTRWQKLSRKNYFGGKLSTKNLVRLCQENASDKPTIIVHTEDVDYTEFFPNSFLVSKSDRKKADLVVDTHYHLDAIPSESYDIVLCTGLLEHVPDPQRLIEDMRRILRPNGKLIMSASAVFSFHEGPENYFHFTPFSFKLLFKDWSEIEDLRGSSMPFETIGILMQRVLLQCDVFPLARPFIELMARSARFFDVFITQQYDTTWKYTDDHKIDSMMPSNIQAVVRK